jgi:hypothetical protein
MRKADLGIGSHRDEVLYGGLRNQRPVERIVMDGRQAIESGNVVAAKSPSAVSHQARGSPTSSLPLADLSTTSQYEMRVRPGIDRRPHDRRKPPWRCHRQQNDVGVQQVAGQISPSRERSRSTGASHPGRSRMRPCMLPKRTFRRVGGGGISCAAGLPLRVMTTGSASSTARTS